ncbi:MAG TPA: sortase [Chloroflexota bacterium]|jgi:LPXTG-site transpeptidase (sortase) family protein|nr:sortase [Chloroflexota bacterium]
MARLGTALIVVGVVLIGYAGLWQLGLAPGSRITLPPPVALQRTPTPVTLAVDTAVVPTAMPVVPATRVPVPTLMPASPRHMPPLPQAPDAADRKPVVQVPPLPEAPDAADRKVDARLPPAGYAVRLSIPAIKLDTRVQQGGIASDDTGNPVWQTLPFVAVHYGDLTALVGARGNAVIAGHVVTLREGNVFRFLYRVNLDDEIQIWDENEREHTFRVVDVKLVPPSDISVMTPTREPTLTLITCGGTFDPRTREFSDRLIVTAKPV